MRKFLCVLFLLVAVSLGSVPVASAHGVVGARSFVSVNVGHGFGFNSFSSFGFHSHFCNSFAVATPYVPSVVIAPQVIVPSVVVQPAIVQTQIIQPAIVQTAVVQSAVAVPAVSTCSACVSAAAIVPSFSSFAVASPFVGVNVFAAHSFHGRARGGLFGGHSGKQVIRQRTVIRNR